MFRKKIAFKLTAGFVAIVLVSMLAIGILFIQLFKQYTYDSQEKTMLMRAHSISEVMSQNMLENGQIRGFGGFMRFLDTLTESKVWITDKQGNPAVMSGMGMGMGQMHAYNSEPLPPEAEKVMQEVLSGKESISESFSSVYNEATMTVGVPILDSDNRVVGSVFLHAPVMGITETLNKAEGILAVSLLAALFISVGLGIFYSILFTRPLKAMNSTALEMAQGNYNARTGVSRSDELGQLGSSLDMLAYNLGYTIDQLFQEKVKLNDIISSISEGLIAFDTDLKPLNTNSALSQIMSRSIPYVSETLEKDLQAMGIDTSLGKVIKEKKGSIVITEWMVKKLKFTISPIEDNLGNVTGCVALVQDISASERLEQLRRDFIANISHEFRTPLTVMRGSLETLADGTVEKPEDIQRFYQRMLSETRSLERLVGDLLELSRLQSGKIAMNLEKLYIPDLLTDTIRSLQTIADRKGIKIEFISGQDLPLVLVDYDRLRQLFVIFLDNAIKYSPDNTRISIKPAVHEPHLLTLLIQDQGYGIAAEELSYIWDRFYKADKARKGNGTGLGLAIAKHLVELHNGKVSVQSEVNKGTIIELKLPLA